MQAAPSRSAKWIANLINSKTNLHGGGSNPVTARRGGPERILSDLGGTDRCDYRGFMGLLARGENTLEKRTLSGARDAIPATESELRISMTKALAEDGRLTFFPNFNPSAGLQCATIPAGHAFDDKPLLELPVDSGGCESMPLSPHSWKTACDGNTGRVRISGFGMYMPGQKPLHDLDVGDKKAVIFAVGGVKDRTRVITLCDAP